MAGMRGKPAADKFSYSVTETITVTVSQTRALVPHKETEPMYFWSWAILVEGKVRFGGSDLITSHNRPQNAALTILADYCPADGKVPDWFKGDANASQKNWFKITGPRMAPVLNRIYTIGHYPGAQLITDDGLIPFSKDGIAMNVPVAQLQEVEEYAEYSISAEPVPELYMDVVIGEVSEGVRRAIDASENRDRSSGNVAALNPTLLTSPFSD